MALPNLTNIAKKPMNPKADALAKMMDTSTIAQAGQPMAQKPPTLGTATGVAPMVKPMGFGGGPQQPQMQRPTAPSAPTRPTTVQAGGTVVAPAQRPVTPVTPKIPGIPAAPTPVTTSPVVKPEPAPTPAAPATQDDIDAMIRKFVEGQLANAGNVDTSAQEALIRDQMEGELGASLVDQRARMGRAGFGAGGVTAALESDARTNASREALDQILGFRTSEEQRSIDNARKAVTTEQDMRGAASDDALRRMILETLQAEAGLEDVPADTGGSIPNPGDVAQSLTGTGAYEEKENLTEIKDGNDPGKPMKNVGAMPPDAVPVDGYPGVFWSERLRKYLTKG